MQSWLSWFARGLLILGFLVLIGRLIELQIIKGEYFRTLAEGNRIRSVPIVAPRGRVLARGGEVLVGNREVKRRVVFDPASGYQKLEDLTGGQEDEIITEWVRDYKLGSDFAHVGGYLGEVGKNEVGKINPECPQKGAKRSGILVGRAGLEAFYECILAGIDGEELVEVDALGRRVRTLGRKEPVAGQDLRTSIDLKLQKKVAATMQDKKGAVIITDTRGEVLALYSAPSYDPAKIKAVLKDPDRPLFNRAISGLFPPGSVYKPIVALAALEEGKIDENFSFDDPGQIIIQSPYGTFTYANWYFTYFGKKEGKIGLVRAIARSTDTFFYKLGELVGIEKLNEWSHQFGLDEIGGIDLPAEVAGLVPSPAWKERVKGERWFLGNTYHVSIGQGDIALTPLGINRAISAIASGGLLCSPKIAEKPQCVSLALAKKSIELVKEGMTEACQTGGTGFTFFDFEPPVVCKTGTAETNEEGKTHAWFTVFGPGQLPEIVVSVLVEKGGSVAGPIARDIFDYYFNP